MYSFHSLKVCFVGIGSIARKHIANLLDICHQYKIEIQIDALRRKESKEMSEIVNLLPQNGHVFYEIERLPEDYDVIFITNPTDLHIETLQLVHSKGKHFFIEKPIVSARKGGEVLDFIKRKECIYYVACPMRYSAVIQYIKKSILPNEVIGVRSLCSSYLPEWRPGTDYRKCYSASRSLGGGVAIDLIHEWDYLTYLFGFPEKIVASFTKKSELEMDVEDYAAYIAEYKDKMVELHLDYYGRKALREVVIFTKNDTMVGDLINNTILYLKSNSVINFPDKLGDNMRNELIHFMDIIDGKAENDNDINTAYKTLLLTQGILEEKI